MIMRPCPLFFGDVGDNFDEGGPGVRHVRIEASLFFPELADPGALVGVESAHYSVDVLLVAASSVAFRKGVPADAG